MGKRVFSAVALAAALALGVCGCGSPQASSSTDAATNGSASVDASSAASASDSTVPQFATLGDVLGKIEGGIISTSSDELICEGSDGTNYIVVWCDMDYDSFNDIFNNSSSDAMLSLAVSRQEVFTPAAQSEVDKLSGKTGAELEAKGFEYDRSLDQSDGKMRVLASKASDSYLLVFEGIAESTQDKSLAEIVRDLKVTSVYVGS